MLLERIGRAHAVPGLEIGGFEADPQGDGGDGRAVIRFRGQEVVARAAVRSRLSPAGIVHLDLARRAAPSDTPLIVLSDRIGKGNARLLRERGYWYADTDGDIYIDTMSIHILVHGLHGPKSRRHTGTRDGDRSKPLHANWLKVVFAVLSDPLLDADPGRSTLNGTARRMASEAGVALGSVGAIVKDLESRGFIARETGDRRVLINRGALLERWATEYVERLRPKLVRGRFHPGTGEGWTSVPRPAGVLLGGETAAAELTGYLRPERGAFYAAEIPDSLLVRADLRPDPAGEVEWLVPFWGTRDAAGPKGCVHPMIVYAELLADADPRNVETARRLHEQYLRQIVEAA